MQLVYSVEDLIGEGSFGAIFCATLTTDDDETQIVALKRCDHDPDLVRYPFVVHEVCALRQVEGHPSIPKVIAWGVTDWNEYLVLPLYGDDLHGLFLGENDEHSLTMRTLVCVAFQLLDVLEHIHTRGLVHNDISPTNFVLDTTRGRLVLIDFSASRMFRQEDNTLHPNEDTPVKRGTQVYMSLNVHFNQTPSRRDDLESAAYVLIHLLRGELPWTSLDRERLVPTKQRWTGDLLCGQWPPVFGEFLDYCRNLTFEEDPDYARWKICFLDVIPGLTEEEACALTLVDTSSVHVRYVQDSCTPPPEIPERAVNLPEEDGVCILPSDLINPISEEVVQVYRVDLNERFGFDKQLEITKSVPMLAKSPVCIERSDVVEEMREVTQRIPRPNGKRIPLFTQRS